MSFSIKTVLEVIFCLTVLAGCTTTSTYSNSNKDTAKNIVLFIGDGMGISTITATRIYAGQNKNMNGEEYILPFETFPHLALIKTYNSNQQVPDSAGTASAMHTGKKTRAGVIGIGPKPNRADCAASKNAHLATLGELANRRNKAVGIVTTTRLTHATPAAVFAHTPERNWESDSDIPPDQAAAGCSDIARQLINFNFDTALGGGRRAFLGSAKGGNRLDPDADLLALWHSKTEGTVATDLGQLVNADPNRPLLGLFDNSHLPFVQQPQTGQSPSLTIMTQVAISRLSRRQGGYYLIVEGGRIDHAHHDNRAELALAETEEFARAVAKAIEMTNPDDTLILVTADHSHVFTLAGYPTRGNPILGNVIGNDEHGNPNSSPSLAEDGKPYTSVGYANGPGAATGPRTAPDTPTDGSIPRQQALVPLRYETHGGEDVPLYAKGPGAHRVSGVMEQNLIFNVVAAAFGWPEGRTLAGPEHAETRKHSRKTSRCRLLARHGRLHARRTSFAYRFDVLSARYPGYNWYRWPGSLLTWWGTWPYVHSDSYLVATTGFPIPNRWTVHPVLRGAECLRTP